MLVSTRRFRAAQEEVRRLRRELDQASASLARYKEQERELVDALVAARVEARAVRTRAEDEAGSVVEGARDAAATIKAEARAQQEAAQAEIARLRDVQRDLSASLEQSLATLHSVLSHPALPQSSADNPAGRQPASNVPVAAPTPDSGWRAPVAAAKEHRRAADAAASQAVRPETAPSDQARATSGAARSASARALPSRARRVLDAVPTDGRSLLVAAGISLVSLALVAGGLRWRGSANGGSAAEDGSPGGAITAVASSATAGSSTGSGAHRGGAGAAAASRVNVGLKIVRPVWLRARVDGKEAIARLVRAGENLELRGAREIVLRAGDAGAVLMSVNGNADAPLGRDGAVLTRRVAADAGATNAGPARPRGASEASSPAASAGPRPTLPRPAAAVATKQPPLPQVQAVAQVRRVESPLQTPAPQPPAPAPALPGARPQPPAGPAVDTDESEVLRAHETYFEALRRGDTGQINRLVAEGFTATGSPAADEAGLPYPLSLRSASVEIRGVGAVVSGTAAQRISGPDGQAERTQQLLFSEVWIKRGGQWQLMNVRFVSPGPR